MRCRVKESNVQSYNHFSNVAIKMSISKTSQSNCLSNANDIPFQSFFPKKINCLFSASQLAYW